MCGRYALGLSHDEIQNLSGYTIHIRDWVNRDRFRPRYNVAPRSHAPVIRRRNPRNEGDDSAELILDTLKWGLVPHWSKHEDKSMNTINARSENLIDGGGMWGSIKGRRRCAVVCQGYYEWLKRGNSKLPHFVRPKTGGVMLLAGLYDVANIEGKDRVEPLETFTVVTTSANEEFSWLHDRQPVILSTPEALAEWLDTSSQEWSANLVKLLDPYHDATHPLECYQVPQEVGSVGKESPTFVEPISTRKDGIEAMFAKQKQTQNSPKKKGLPTSQTKRKRSASPVVVVTDSKKPQATFAHAKLPAKKTKTEVQIDDDDDEIVCLDGPPTLRNSDAKLPSVSTLF
ncbi:hypothetical protein PLICRDRAFT_108074 [Plicaturopsis crispa FD-325 SS-3]|nr:hypothetical protein PLICRDRAFT_108074 [Plicaturopsis crispa FD-325 SS-3]